MKYKTTPDGRALLNVACSFRTHAVWNNLDFSAYALLAHHKMFAAILNGCGILSADRCKRVVAMDPQIIRHDLRKGIPFSEGIFDAVYNSHFIEHLGKGDALPVLKECKRVLRKGGVLRMVVPDLEIQARNYISEIQRLACGETKDLKNHQKAVHKLFDQMVLTEPGGTREQNPLVRFFERLLRGNTAKAGELHRWMYDKYSLKDLLLTAGFDDVLLMTPSESRIRGWKDYGLDLNAEGMPFHSDSLYMEGIKS